MDTSAFVHMSEYRHMRLVILNLNVAKRDLFLVLKMALILGFILTYFYSIDRGIIF